MTASRDLSTVLWRRGRLSLVAEPRNACIGFCFPPGAVVLYVVPVVGLRWQWRKPVPGQPRTTPDNAEQPAEWMPGQWTGPG